MRRAAKVDSNHVSIVLALRAAGATVQTLAAVGQGCPDLLVGYRKRTLLLEIKDGAKQPSKRHLTGLQAIWHETWRGGALRVVESVDEALTALVDLCADRFGDKAKERQ